MTIITALSYLFSAVFLFFLAKSVRNVILDNRYKRKMRKRSDAIKADRENMRKQGLKEFSFENGKIKLWAKSFKQATAQYQINRKNGMYNL